MIVFKAVKIIGFASVKELKFEFNDRGIHVIKGKNGAGKTSIFNALFWGIYGQTLKEGSSVEQWEHLRAEDYKGAMVEIELEKNDETHYITRFSNYKGKYNGAMGQNRILLSSSTNTHKKEVQKDINQLMGMSAELFKSSILFGQKMKRIIDDKGADKKKVLEQCFDHSILDTLIENVKIEIEKLKPTLSKAETDELQNSKAIDEIDNTIESIKNQNTTAKNLYDTKKKGLQDRLDDLEPYVERYNKKKESLVELKAKIKGQDIKELEAKAEKVRDRKQKKDEKVSKLRITQNNRAKEIDALDKDPICRTCGQEIKDIPTKKIAEIKKALHGDEKVLSDLINGANDLKQKLYDANKLVKDYNDTETQIESLEQLLKESEPNKLKKGINQKLKDLKEPVKKTYENLLKDQEQMAKDLKKLSASSRSLSKEMSFLTWALKDPLSNKGIKAYLFDNLLDNINNSLLKYSHILNLRVEFSIDYSKVNKDIIVKVYDDYDNPVPYVDLSGGQAQIINVATALALHDMINADNPFNILILDEVFESLDSDNIEKVNSLLEEKSIDTSVLIITHQGSFNPTNAIITELRLVNGHTSVA